jgi:hypothetical protein
VPDGNHQDEATPMATSPDNQHKRKLQQLLEQQGQEQDQDQQQQRQHTTAQEQKQQGDEAWQAHTSTEAVQKLLSAKPNSNFEVPELVAMYASQEGLLDAAEPTDARPILLFDLNGTLTAHTSVKKKSGMRALRPGTAALLQLKKSFRCVHRAAQDAAKSRL